MRRLVLAAMFALALGLVGSAPAFAAEVHVPFCGVDPMTGLGGIPNCTFTQTVQGQVSVDPANVNPCSGVVGTATMITNAIFHITVNGAGDIWVTETSTSHFTFVPNIAGPPSYSGELTFWFGGSFNNMNTVLHDIGNIVVNGSDGSQITFHLVDHLSWSATGFVNKFTIMSFTCP